MDFLEKVSKTPVYLESYHDMYTAKDITRIVVTQLFQNDEGRLMIRDSNGAEHYLSLFQLASICKLADEVAKTISKPA